jgi:Domain of unknown function (DUF4190)
MSQPPPGYPPNLPPMGPNMGGYAMPPQSRLSAAAVTSLVCGLVMCIPLVTGIVALITGAIGISATANPAVRGRGLAVAGLILGLVSICAWCFIGYGGYTLYRNSAPQRSFAQSYITDLAAGKLDRCEQNSSGSITQQILQNDYTQLKPWGTLRASTVIPNAWNYENGVTTYGLTGVGMFSGGQHRFQMSVTDVSGKMTVDSFQWLQ